MVVQWKLFEEHIQNLRNIAASKLSIDKAQDLETVVGRFLLDLTAIEGVSVQSAPEIPVIPVLENRAALAIVLISLVCNAPYLLMCRENALVLGQRTIYGQPSIA